MGTINKVIMMAKIAFGIGQTLEKQWERNKVENGRSRAIPRSNEGYTKGKRHMSLKSRSNRRKAILKH